MTDSGNMMLLQQFFDQQASLYGNNIVMELPEIKPASVAVSPAPADQGMQNCQLCGLIKTRIQMVSGTGNPGARLMIIGDFPSQTEDQQGMPFIGEVGDLLDNILSAIGFKREELYITNLIKCRPPNGRAPRLDELKRCLPRLESEVDTVKPQLILALGRLTGCALINQSESIESLRKDLRKYRDIPLIVTYHPAQLIKHPEWKRAVWEDVQKLRKEYDTVVGDKPLWRPPQK